MRARRSCRFVLGLLALSPAACFEESKFTRVNTATDGMAWRIDCGGLGEQDCVDEAKEKCGGPFRTIDRTTRGEITTHRRPNGDETSHKERDTTITFICGRGGRGEEP
jgi:hypothetical protein